MTGSIRLHAAARPLAASFLFAVVIFFPSAAPAPGGKAGARPAIDMRHPGAKGDGTADDFGALSAAVAAVNAAGGGRIRFPPGEYRIDLDRGSTAPFRNCAGVELVADNAVIRISPGRTWRPGETRALFTFDNCSDVTVDGFRVVGTLADLTPGSLYGPEFALFKAGCRNVAMPWNRTEGMAAGAIFQKSPGQPDIVGVRIGTLEVSTAYYGIACQYTGHDVTVGRLSTDTIGRSYFAYGGIQNHRVNVVSKDPRLNDCMIGTHLGFGIEGLDLTYMNTATTRSTDGSARIYLYWGDERPAAIRDVRIRVHSVYLPGVRSGGATLTIMKQTTQGLPDKKDRGHLLDNLVVSGTVDGAPHYEPYAVNTLSSCSWGGGDTWRNVRFEDYSTPDKRVWTLLDLRSLKGEATIRNVRAGKVFAVIGPPDGSGRITFDNCVAAQFTTGASDVSRHTYRDSTITDDPALIYAGGNGRTNKTFIRTRYGRNLIE